MCLLPLLGVQNKVCLWELAGGPRTSTRLALIRTSPWPHPNPSEASQLSFNPKNLIGRGNYGATGRRTNKALIVQCKLSPKRSELGLA